MRGTACPAAGRSTVHDLVGIGFGPSNLALAIALRSTTAPAADEPVDARVPGAAAALRLAPGHAASTTRPCRCPSSRTWSRCATRPASSASCATCRSKGRLIDFINHKTPVPAAGGVPRLPRVGGRPGRRPGRATAPRSSPSTPVPSPDGVVEYARRDRPGRAATARPRPPGPQPRHRPPGCDPRLPRGRRRGERDLAQLRPADQRRRAGRRPRRRFVVVGAGQSAAEVVAYLHRALPRRRGLRGLRPLRLQPRRRQPFANRIFDPGGGRRLLRRARRTSSDRCWATTRNTNYSVVDIDLIDDAVPAARTRRRSSARERLRFLNVSRLTDVGRDAGRCRVTVESLPTGERDRARRRRRSSSPPATARRPARRSSARSASCCPRDERGPRPRRAATTASRPTPSCAAASTCRAAPSTPTASPPPCCPTPPSGPARSSTRWRDGCASARPTRFPLTGGCSPTPRSRVPTGPSRAT